MCQHGDSTRILVETLVQDLYPAIQHQFIIVSSYNEQTDEDDAAYHKIHEPLNDLKHEFQSLLSYETKLVFPSVLKVFDHADPGSKAQMPNIADLQQLTTGKEHRILHLANILSAGLSTENTTEEHVEIGKLVTLFKNDFDTLKTKWNNMIHDRLQGCACFRNANNIVTNKIELP